MIGYGRSGIRQLPRRAGLLARTSLEPRTARTLLALGLAVLVGCSSDQQSGGDSRGEAAEPEADARVALETSAGRIVIDVKREEAPQTATNFLRLVEAGFYDGLIFHRVKGNFAQGGGFTEEMNRRTAGLPPVPNEAENGLKNVRGAVAMARQSDPHSATTEFFINTTHNAGFDFKDRSLEGWGYAVFGEVVEGMDVVDAITGSPTTRRNRMFDVPLDPVVIDSAYLLNGD